MFYNEEFNLQTANRLNKLHEESLEPRFCLNPTGFLNLHTLRLLQGMMLRLEESMCILFRQCTGTISHVLHILHSKQPQSLEHNVYNHCSQDAHCLILFYLLKSEQKNYIKGPLSNVLLLPPWYLCLYCYLSCVTVKFGRASRKSVAITPD